MLAVILVTYFMVWPFQQSLFQEQRVVVAAVARQQTSNVPLISTDSQLETVVYKR
jgi:hypothetical protein